MGICTERDLTLTCDILHLHTWKLALPLPLAQTHSFISQAKAKAKANAKNYLTQFLRTSNLENRRKFKKTNECNEYHGSSGRTKSTHAHSE